MVSKSYGMSLYLNLALLTNQLSCEMLALVQIGVSDAKLPYSILFVCLMTIIASSHLNYGTVGLIYTYTQFFAAIRLTDSSNSSRKQILTTLLKVAHDGMSCEIIKLMQNPMKKSPKPHEGKSLIMRQKFDKVAKIDKATKGE